MSKLFLLHLGLLLSLTTFAGPDRSNDVSVTGDPAIDLSTTDLSTTKLGNSIADATLVQDPHTEICMAALESRSAVRSKAFELKIGRRELNKIRCNDMSVMAFAKQHGNEVNNWSIATVQ